MTQATVATDLHKAVDVLANFTMEVAFSGDVCGDIVTEFGQIVLSEIAARGYRGLRPFQRGSS